MDLLWPSLAAVVIAGIVCFTWLRATRITQADDFYALKAALEARMRDLHSAQTESATKLETDVAELKSWCGRLSGEMDAPRNVRRGA